MIESPRYYVGGCLFFFLCILPFLYWVCVPLNDTQFVHGFPRFATPPSPNGFKSSRYGYDWWLLWSLSLNGLLPMLLLFALLKSNYKEFSKIHLVLSALFTFANIILFFWIWGRLVFTCNTGYSQVNTACNDPQWCCVYFAATPEAAKWCQNTTPCSPAVTTLSISSQYYQHWIFSAIFAVIALFNVLVNKGLDSNGVFK